MKIMTRFQAAFLGRKAASDRDNIIMTGPPQAGKTLAITLLNRLPEVVALSEPLLQQQLKDRRTALRETSRMFRGTRNSLEADGTIITKLNQKTQLSCAGEEAYEPVEMVQGRHRWRVRWNRVLPARFFLIVEHAAPFTALLPELIARYPCYAIIRNPLCLLAAWNERDGTLRAGRLPRAQMLDPGLNAALSRIPDVLDRQIRILSWFFEQYLSFPPAAVITYESILRSSGKVLSAIVPQAEGLEDGLDIQEDKELAACPLRETLAERLLQSEGAYWKFYDKESVQAVLEAVP